MTNKIRKAFDKLDYKEDYLKTFFTTLAIVVLFVILNIFYMIHNIFNQDVNSKKQNIDSAFEAYLVDILIDKNKTLSVRYPKNYALNMRLGILYSYKKDYASAEKEFINSAEKAVDYDYTPTYQLAKLYIKTDKLKKAQEIMDKINDKPNKRLLRFKGDIYSLLGDSYYNQGYYALSVMKYEKASQYYKAIKEKLITLINNKSVDAYIALADKYVEVGKIDEAIMSLEKAYEIRPKNIILNYKLALLYIDNNPKKAHELLKFVNKKDPQLINHDAYYDLLNKLADIEFKNGDLTNGELYQKKAEQYQKFVKNNILQDKDLFVSITKKEIKTDIAAEEFITTIQFTLQNNSGLDIENLTIHAIFKDGNKIIQNHSQKIFDDIKIFKAGSVSSPILVSASNTYKNNRTGDISVDIFAYKYPKYTIKIYSTSIPKPQINK